MGQRHFCGWGSGRCAKVIGWFQILATVSGIIVLITALYINPAASQKENEEVFERMQRNNMVMALMLLLAILSFIMATLLLRGSYKRNPRQIKAWMVFTIVSIFLLTLVTILAFVIRSYLIISVSLVISLVVQGLCLWAVSIYKKEVDSTSVTFIPVKV